MSSEHEFLFDYLPIVNIASYNQKKAKFQAYFWLEMNASMAGDYSSFEGQISLLRPATLVKLSHILNPTKVLLTDDGHLR